MSTDARSGVQPPSVSEVASAYVDGEVGADQAAWVEANRATDTALAAEIDGFGNVKSLLGGLGIPDPGERGWEAMSAGARREIAAAARQTWVARVSAAAAAVVVLVAAVALGAVFVTAGPVPDTRPQAVPALLAPSSTPSAPPRSGTGAVAAARGIRSAVERVGVSPGYGLSATSTTTTRPPLATTPKRGQAVP